MTLIQQEPKAIKIGSTAVKKVTIRPNGTEKQIRPAIKIIECDFTTGDNGFVFSWRNNAAYGYGRDSNGFYVSGTSYPGVVNYKIPSDIYSKNIIKIELHLYCATAGSGGGIAINNGDNPTLRVWGYSNIGIQNLFSGGGSLSVPTPAGGYKFTIDIKNKQAYTDTSGSIFTIPDATITAIQSYMSAGQLSLCIMKNSSSYAYIKKAVFYIE